MTTLSTTPSAPPSTALAGALEMARRGFPIFPLMPKSKIPVQKRNCLPHMRELAGGINIATTNSIRILLWHQKCPGANFAVRTDGLCVLDVDVKPDKDGLGKEGLEDYVALGVFDDTLKVRTPSGGLHVYYKAPPGGAGQRPITPSIDVRGVNGYVVAPGSVTEQGSYEITRNVPIADFPAKLEGKISKPGERSRGATPSKGPGNEGRRALKRRAKLREQPEDMPGTRESALEFLKAHPPAIQGKGGDRHTYVTACTLRDMGLSKETAFELMWGPWNDRCEPPWDWEGLERKVNNAYAYARDPLGNNSAVVDFGDVPKTAKPQEAAEASAKSPQKRYRLNYADDISFEPIKAMDRDALIRGILDPGKLAVVYGDPGSGKTFILLDLVGRLANGKGDAEGWPVGDKPTWCGHGFRPVPSMYIALEGEGGLDKRLLALKMSLGSFGPWLATAVIENFTLAQSAGQEGGKSRAEACVDTIVEASNDLSERAGQPTGLIIIDTLSRAIAGDDENAQKAISNLVDMAKRLADKTGAAVLLVHHTNKNGGIRGSSVIRGDFDTILRVDRDGGNKKRRLVAEKVREGEEKPLCDFELEVVTLGLNDEHEPITSCVVRKSPPSKLSKPNEPSAKRQKKEPQRASVFKASFALLVDSQGEAENGDAKVPVKELRARFLKLYGTKTTEDAAKRQAFSKVMKELPAGYSLTPDGNFVVHHALFQEVESGNGSDDGEDGQSVTCDFWGEKSQKSQVTTGPDAL